MWTLKSVESIVILMPRVRSKANFSRRQGTAKEGEFPNGDVLVHLWGDKGEDFGTFEIPANLAYGELDIKQRGGRGKLV
jgi:hypothetical protein